MKRFSNKYSGIVMGLVLHSAYADDFLIREVERVNEYFQKRIEENFPFSLQDEFKNKSHQELHKQEFPLVVFRNGIKIAQNEQDLVVSIPALKATSDVTYDNENHSVIISLEQNDTTKISAIIKEKNIEIMAVKKSQREEKEADTSRERSFITSQWSTYTPLPQAILVDSVQATYENEMLVLTFNKKIEMKKTHTIPIQIK
jgi:HSP20 family molecular chaperone IbpA